MSYPAELCALAKRVIWFESAEETLRYPKRFLAYLMTFGTLEEILTAKKYFSDQNFEEVPGRSARRAVLELLERRVQT
jgi:hypothetical protein